MNGHQVASRYNLQAELSYAQRRYDKAKIEYFLEAVYLVWEESLHRNRGAFDEKLLVTSVKNALVRAAKSAFYDGKGNTKALWLLSQRPWRTVELVRERLGLEPRPARAEDPLDEERFARSSEPRKSFLEELSDLGSDLKQSVLQGIRKIINR